MLHKIYDFFANSPHPNDGTTPPPDPKQDDEFVMSTLMDHNSQLMEDNAKLMKKNKELKEEKEIPPLKICLRSTRKKRPWCWGILMMLMALIQTVLVASGKQRTARRHLISVLKELEYHYGFRFVAIEEGEELDERKG